MSVSPYAAPGVVVDAAEVRITTERLELRRFSPGDHEALARISADPVNRAYMESGVIDGERVAANLQQWIAGYAKGHGFLAVVERASGMLIGQCGFEPTETGELELGYMLDHPHWGCGYATEAASAVVRDVMEAREPCPPIVAAVHRDNAASKRVVEKLGFVRAERTDGETEWYRLEGVSGSTAEAADGAVGG